MIMTINIINIINIITLVNLQAGPNHTSRRQRKKSLIALPSLHLASKYGEPVPEPKCFPVFRWCLSLLGLTMLIIVIIIMCQLISEWIGSSVEMSNIDVSTGTTSTEVTPTMSAHNNNNNNNNASQQTLLTTQPVETSVSPSPSL